MSKNLKEAGKEAMRVFKGRFWHKNSGSKMLQVGVYLEYSRNSRETSEAEVVEVSRCGQGSPRDDFSRAGSYCKFFDPDSE